MNISLKIHDPSLDNDETIALDVLFLRMKGELCKLSKICAEVENALGELIEAPNKPLDKPIVTLQGLDRLRQSLEDFARLSEILEKTQKLSPAGTISQQTISRNLVLADLAERLTKGDNLHRTKIDFEQDVIWG